jgi:aspartate aminotransferase
MTAAGVDMVSFAAGEPDFNTPDPICQAAKEALDAGFTKYTPSSGIRDLREAISEKLWKDNGVTADPDSIIVSNGAKQSVYNSLMVLLNQGDEVILIAPYWMTYRDQIVLAGGTPVVVHTQGANNFVPDVESIRAAVTERTKAILINSPSNPTGAVFPRSVLKAIGELAVEKGLWLICDEIYEQLIYEGEHYSMAAFGSDIAERTITIGGCSKTYSMTGWRIGFAAGPKHVIEAMSSLQDQVTSGASSFGQKGAVRAFHLDAGAVEEMRLTFLRRRDVMYRGLQTISGLEVVRPAGAFYFFVGAKAFLGGRVKDDFELAEYLLEKAHVAAIPGCVFEGDGHLRFSYTSTEADIERGIERIGGALQSLR